MERVRWIVVRIVRHHFGGAIRWLECYYTREEDGGVEGAELRLYAKRSGSHFVDEKTGLDPRMKNRRRGEVTGDAAYIHAKRPSLAWIRGL